MAGSDRLASGYGGSCPASAVVDRASPSGKASGCLSRAWDTNGCWATAGIGGSIITLPWASGTPATCSRGVPHLEAGLEVGDGLLGVGGDHGHRVGGGDEELLAQDHVAVAIAVGRRSKSRCVLPPHRLHQVMRVRQVGVRVPAPKVLLRDRVAAGAQLAQGQAAGPAGSTTIWAVCLIGLAFPWPTFPNLRLKQCRAAEMLHCSSWQHVFASGV